MNINARLNGWEESFARNYANYLNLDIQFNVMKKTKQIKKKTILGNKKNQKCLIH